MSLLACELVRSITSEPCTTFNPVHIRFQKNDQAAVILQWISKPSMLVFAVLLSFIMQGSLCQTPSMIDWPESLLGREEAPVSDYGSSQATICTIVACSNTYCSTVA